MALINERRFEMKKAQNSELTMLASIAGIVSLAKGSYLSNDFFEKADGFISYYVRVSVKCRPSSFLSS